MPLRDLWLQIKSSDELVVQYRKWLDEYGASMPSGRGFATVRPAREAAHAGRPPAVNRFQLHTSICASCSRAHRVAEHASKALIAAIVVLLAAGVLSSGTLSVVSTTAALAAGLGAVIARAVKRRFE